MVRLKKIRKDYQEFIQLMKDNGHPLLAFKAPCCGEEIETLPAPKKEFWDSLSICPHCGKFYVKLVSHDLAEGVMPEFPDAEEE